MGLLALLVLTACGGSAQDPDGTAEAGSGPVDGPGVPEAVPLGDGGTEPSPNPSPDHGTVQDAELWILPAEAEGWKRASWGKDGPGVYRYEHAEFSCTATYTETPLEELRDEVNSPQDTLDATLDTMRDIFDWATPIPISRLRFADPEAALTFATTATVYPSYAEEDYVLVASAHRTSTHELTASMACPEAGWATGTEKISLDFLQSARFDPSLR